MPRRRANWTDKLEPSKLQELHEWIDSARNYKAGDLFVVFALAEICSLRTFRGYVQERRRKRRAEPPDAGELPPSSPSLSRLKELARGAVVESLVSGKMPAYALPSLLGGISQLERAQVAELAEERAREMHEHKLSELRAKQTAAVEGLAAAKTLSDAQVAEIKEKVLGLGAVA